MIWMHAVALASAPSHGQLEQASWSTVATREHAAAGPVEVWRTDIAGLECFQATAVTDLEPSKLLDVVRDVEGAIQWSSAGVSEAKMLADNGSKLEYYQYLDVPGWTMASDRFWFLSSDIESTADRVAFRWDRLEHGGPHKATYDDLMVRHPKAIEPPINVGGWYFDRIDGRTTIAYRVCSHPGGSIPVAVQNAATRKTLPDTVGDSVREAKKR